MKYVQVGSPASKYSTEPFPAIRGELVFGRNKRQGLMVPVINLPLAATYKAYGFNRTLVYEGQDKDAADAAAATEKQKFADRPMWSGDFKVEAQPVMLPDHGFFVGTTKNGAVAIFGGSDTTNRCLLHIQVKDGFRGYSKLMPSEGVKRVAYAEAHAACEGACEGLYILEINQHVAAYSNGRHGSSVVEYGWDGTQVVTTRYTGADWEAKQQISQDAEAATRM